MNNNQELLDNTAKAAAKFWCDFLVPKPENSQANKGYPGEVVLDQFSMALNSLLKEKLKQKSVFVLETEQVAKAELETLIFSFNINPGILPEFTKTTIYIGKIKIIDSSGKEGVIDLA